MTLAQLTADVKVIVDILARLVDFGLIDIIHEKDINYEDVDSIEYVLTRIADLNLLAVKKDRLLNYLIDQVEVLDLSAIEVEAINLNADILVLIDIYRAVLPLIMNEGFPYKKASDFEVPVYVEDLKETYLNRESLVHVIAAFRLLQDTTFFKEVAHPLINALTDTLPEEYSELANFTYYDEDKLLRDIEILTDILEKLNDFNIVTLITDKDLDISDLTLVKAVLDDLFSSVTLKDKYATLVDFILEKLDVDTNGINLTDVDFDQELDAWKNIIDQIQVLLADENITLISELRDLIDNLSEDILDEITNARIVNVANLVEAVLDTRLVFEAITNIYNKFVVEELGARDTELAQLLSIDNFTKVQFVDDIRKLMAVAKDAAELDVVNRYRTFKDEFEAAIGNEAKLRAIRNLIEIRFAQLDQVERIITNLFNLTFVDQKAQDLLVYFDTEGKLTYIDLTDVDWAHDAAVISTMIQILRDTEELEGVSILRPTLEIFENEQVFRNAYNAYEEFLTLDLFTKVVIPYLHGEILPRVSFGDTQVFDPLLGLTEEELYGLFVDLKTAFGKIIDMGFFNENGVNFNVRSDIEFLYDLFRPYVTLTAEHEELIDKMIMVISSFGVLKIDYTGVSLRSEVDILKNILTQVENIVAEMRNGVSLDLNIFKNDVVMTSVENIIRELAASEIYYQVLEDVINRIVVHNVEHDNFVLLDAIERSEWVDVGRYRSNS